MGAVAGAGVGDGVGSCVAWSLGEGDCDESSGVGIALSSSVFSAGSGVVSGVVSCWVLLGTRLGK